MISGSYKSFKSLNSLIPMPSVMDRYIASELLLPFFVWCRGFCSVGVAVGAVFELVRKVVESGLSLTIAINILLLKLPYFIMYALPTAVLLATLMTYSRLSSDSELIAMRSCGVSIYRLVLPAIVLSFVVTGMTFILHEQVVPIANYQASLTLGQALQKRTIIPEAKHLLSRIPGSYPARWR
jgi:lipopolysaccharide export system permease protein